MPGIDGFTLADWIKQQEMPDVRVIMMLTFPHLKRKQAFKALGIKNGLLKPVGETELLDTILAVMKLKIPTQELLPMKTDLTRQSSAFNLKILVAEDTPFNQKFIMRLLERWNHQAVLVEDGRQAINALKKESFDIVLMDVQMPEMDGLEATRVIRRNEQFSGEHIPIIAMTAHAIKGDRERCLEAGVDEYVSKPIDSEKLFDIIEALLRQRNSKENPEDPSTGIDKETLLKAFDQDWSFLKEVVDVFLSDYPRLMDVLRTAFSQRDAPTLMRTAHSLKGMLKNFQADTAAEVAFEIEKKGKQEEFDGLDPAIKSLAGHLKKVEAALHNLIEQQDT
jgi:CheY-like chemotaxis protein/HPt (histidine-containing phosphotransfer) domain-containing protein